jgi:DNA-binding transcriptional regulator LsrR (DeoR family)
MSYSLKLLHEVASLYYLEDLKQESIGRRLKISKYTVSRVLKKARAKGLIKIQVVDPHYKNYD